jgi:hypothetical protein
MFGLTPERDNTKFIKGKHITWQQHDLLLAVEQALAGKAPRRISVESGHGTGKSTTLSWLILWFLFCFPDAQVPCTAPTSDQIYDVLWKEIKKWMNKLPEPVKASYEWQSAYIRIKDSPETWFARAKTARKEEPEALAGIHADHVMMIVDEASGVPEEIFNTAEGALTNANVLVILISNHTRLVGYFHDTHAKDKKNWQTLSFDSRESPIVDAQFVSRIAEKHGEDSDEYRIRVMGKAPKEDAIDDKGYVPLLSESDIHQTFDGVFTGRLRLGVDPAGEGDDESVWVLRDGFKAKIVGKEKTSTSKSIAQKTLTLMDYHQVPAESVYIDNFGSGANVGQELAYAGHMVQAVYVGDPAFDKETYLNRRAESYWRLREWLKKGGELVQAKEWDELLTIRYRRELNDKVKIMSKLDMKKEGFKSPNVADALMLTFYDDEGYVDPERPIYTDDSAGKLAY